MAAETITAYPGYSLDLGTFTIGPEGTNFSGSTPIVRLGREVKAGEMETLLELSGMTWDDSDGILSDVELSVAQVDTLAAEDVPIVLNVGVEFSGGVRRFAGKWQISFDRSTLAAL